MTILVFNYMTSYKIVTFIYLTFTWKEYTYVVVVVIMTQQKSLCYS